MLAKISNTQPLSSKNYAGETVFSDFRHQNGDHLAYTTLLYLRISLYILVLKVDGYVFKRSS
jgi:hypothetical protein